MAKLNIYDETLKTIVKTYEVADWELSFGAAQDLFDLVDDAENLTGAKAAKWLIGHRQGIEELVLQVFGSEGLTKEELRRTRYKDLPAVLLELYTGAVESISKN